MELKIAVTQTFNIEALDRHLRAITQLVAGVTVAGPGGPSRAFEAVEVVVVLTEPVDDALQNALIRAVTTHDYKQRLPEQDAQDAQRAAREDARARFVASAIAGRTPEQIYTAMQTQMDTWGSLADAKRDLKAWLPLLAAVLAWEVISD